MATEGVTPEGRLEAATGGGPVEPLAVAPVSHILGTLEVFDPATDTVLSYLEHVELFFAVNGIAAEKKVPVFLNAVGKQHYQLLSNLFAPDSPVTKSMAEIVDKLEGHY